MKRRVAAADGKGRVHRWWPVVLAAVLGGCDGGPPKDAPAAKAPRVYRRSGGQLTRIPGLAGARLAVW